MKFVLFLLPLLVTGVESSFNICQACDALVDELINIAKNNEGNIEKKVDGIVDKLCSHAPFLKAQCKTLLVKEANNIIDKINNGQTDANILKGTCGRLPGCSSFIVEKSGQACGMCQAVAKKIDAALHNSQGKVDGEVNELISQLCTVISGKIPIIPAKTCINLLDKYIDQLLNSGISKIDVGKICIALKLCPKSQAVEEKVPEEMNPGFGCTLCEKVIGGFIKYLQGAAIEKQIEQTFFQACQAVIPNVDEQQECISIINQTFPKLWAKILSFLNPKDFCTQTHLCSSVVQHSYSKIQQFDGGLGQIGCSFCKTIFQWFQNTIMTPAMEQKMLTAIDGVCQYLMNQDYIDKCDALVKEYGDKLFKYIIGALGPDTICKEVGACAKAVRFY